MCLVEIDCSAARPVARPDARVVVLSEPLCLHDTAELTKDVTRSKNLENMLGDFVASSKPLRDLCASYDVYDLYNAGL